MVFLRQASRAAFRAVPSSSRAVSTSSLLVGQNRPSLLLNNGARQMMAARNASSDDGSVTVSEHSKHQNQQGGSGRVEGVVVF